MTTTFKRDSRWVTAKKRKNRVRASILEQLEPRHLLASDLTSVELNRNSALMDAAQQYLSAVPDTSVRSQLGSQLNGKTPTSFLKKDGLAYDLISDQNAIKQRFAEGSISSDWVLSSATSRSPSELQDSKTSVAGLEAIEEWKGFSSSFGLEIDPNQQRVDVSPSDVARLQNESVLNSLSSMFLGSNLSVTPKAIPESTVDLGGEFTVGWACDIYGNIIQSTNSFAVETNSSAEGENGDGSSDYQLPANAPPTSYPSLVFSQGASSYDSFLPVGSGTSFRQVETRGNYTESTTQPDAHTPGTHWVHIVDQQITSPDVWQFTESLVMGFYETTSGSDANGGTSGFVHSGTIVLSFTASQGVLGPANAGVAWALIINFIESLAFSFSTNGTSSAQPNSLSTTAATALTLGPAGDASIPWDGSALPPSYSGTSSWNSAVFIIATVSGDFT